MSVILTLAIKYDRDVLLARQRTKQIARMLGFEVQDQTRLATAVSEIARNAFSYGGGGKIEFEIEGRTPPQLFLIRVSDNGPGIADVNKILQGRYDSPTGMGLGIVGARRLMDRFDIESKIGGGTRVLLGKLLPARAPLVTGDTLAHIGGELAREQPRDVVEELQQQNQELLRALEELTRRQEEIAAINRELEDTNRGVVALFAELDEKADHLRRADVIKTRFISNMSHEFRTPVNSIQALARLLLDGTDGVLGGEQERQVLFIKRAADSLSELVNDLLDLAKVEAGKIAVRPVHFDVANLFGALRGMLRPLLLNESVELVFDEPEGVPELYTDEPKVSQILRNFISNALKFTERGEVRIVARPLPEERAVAFSVIDTGIGIAPEDQERIFDEFTQIDSVIQRRVRGTGLGLPLCRKLANLLGGRVLLESTPGIGSTFTAVVPWFYQGAVEPAPEWKVDPARIPILVVEDSAETVVLYERYLDSGRFQLLSARTVREARDALVAMRPGAIVLDILLRGEDTWELLAELKRRDDTQDIPVLVVTAVEEGGKAAGLGADAYLPKPVERNLLLQMLTQLVTPERVRSVLVVDDEEISRYVLRQHLTAPEHVVTEATSGAEAIELARARRPDVICLDLNMPGDDGGAVLRRLRADPQTRDIPVVIVTSKLLGDDERSELLELASSVLSKDVTREQALATVREAMARSA